jgi:pimeloyl-ACP methyl ester carboxylesterase
MARSRVYTTWEKLRYFRAERFSLAHLYDDLAAVDLFAEIPALDVPAYFVHGRHDHQVPMSVARAYHDALDAPHKEFVVFDDAAHSPLFEDPDRFHRLMRQVVDRTGHAAARSPHATALLAPAAPATEDRP